MEVIFEVNLVNHKWEGLCDGLKEENLHFDNLLLLHLNFEPITYSDSLVICNR